MKNKILLKRKYKGCYAVVNAVAQHEDDSQMNMNVVISEDNPKEWTIEGATRTHYKSKKEAIKVLENEWINDIKIVWTNKEVTRMRKRTL